MTVKDPDSKDINSKDIPLETISKRAKWHSVGYTPSFTYCPACKQSIGWHPKEDRCWNCNQRVIWK